jgi:hypothetical protein
LEDAIATKQQHLSIKQFFFKLAFSFA